MTMAANDTAFAFQEQGDILIVVPPAEFAHVRDTEVRNAYNEAYRRLSGDGVRHLVFDFSNLAWFGSTFVGIMIRLAKKARLEGGEAALCHMSEASLGMLRQLMLLENTQTNFFWTPFDTREAALVWLETRSAEDGQGDTTRPAT